MNNMITPNPKFVELSPAMLQMKRHLSITAYNHGYALARRYYRLCNYDIEKVPALFSMVVNPKHHYTYIGATRVMYGILSYYTNIQHSIKEHKYNQMDIWEKHGLF